MGRLLTAGLLAALACAGGAHAQTVLKIGYGMAPTSHMAVGATVFCQGIEQGTQGRYTCQQFPNAALGGEREMIEAVQLGTQDVVNASSGTLGNFVPEVKILDIPFLFRDYDHAHHVMDGPIGQQLLKDVQARGLRALAWTENGFRHITNNKHPIVQASDARGLKIRTMENKVHMDGYKTFGMLPTPMAWPEVFTALQQGTVDGQENPISVILSARLAEVQKYLSLTRHVYSPAVLILSENVWNELSEADRQVFVQAARDAGAAQRKRVADDEADGVAQLREAGMQVVEQVDADSFRQALVPAYAGYAKTFGADRIAAIQAVR
ncbi:DctP family TRAP transporter solute-binding subunit [Bordetella petrii]|nr:DctP family TRAP transporter solute-binding subunit [Bordetella petrii]